jgi:aminomethyltransferase
MTQKTVLNVHRRFGAKMVDFGGWDMPLSLRLADRGTPRRAPRLRHVRRLAHVRRRCRRRRRQGFLRACRQQRRQAQGPGKALYSAMLNEAGGVVDDLIVYYLATATYRIVINAGTPTKDLAWMEARLADWGKSPSVRRAATWR